LGVFKNPLWEAVVLISILLAFPIGWQIREYIKKKYPGVVPLRKRHLSIEKITPGKNWIYHKLRAV
jgi:hypothetical protein